MEDGEVVIAGGNKHNIYDLQRMPVQRQPVAVGWEWTANGKGEYPHYMIKEIHEQPDAIRQSLAQDDRLINRMAVDILRARQVVFVACGTSRYAALIGRYAFSQIGHTFSDVVIASEFGIFPIL